MRSCIWGEAGPRWKLGDLGGVWRLAPRWPSFHFTPLLKVVLPIKRRSPIDNCISILRFGLGLGLGLSITANDIIWEKFSEFRICISYVYLQSVFSGSMFLYSEVLWYAEMSQTMGNIVNRPILSYGDLWASFSGGVSLYCMTRIKEMEAGREYY